ncbi:MAG TPA: HAD hydrolase family protein [Coriobacteriia bacterium]|nr:HAD hydrolase family protein [Coriobacteriia bacterium]
MSLPIPALQTHPLVPEALRRASVLYTDLDGTLLGPGATLLADADGRPWTGVAEAIVALNAAGLTCIICSGRSRWQLMDVSRLLGWDSFIAEVGCVVVPGRGEPPIYHTGSWEPDVLAGGLSPYEAIARAGALEVLAREFPGRIEEHAPWHVNREATHVLRGDVPLADAQAALDGLPLAVRIVDNGIIHPPRHTLRGVDEVHAYHLIPDGVHKSDAIVRDLERRGLRSDDAIAVGDSATDVEMAHGVALGVLVANALQDRRAVEAARSFGNIAVTSRPRGEGWAELARMWLEARRSHEEPR